jgi:hypothetical protein
MTSGLLYEPRALWSIGNFAQPDVGTYRNIQSLNRNHFMNVGKHPIELRRMTLSMVNYIFLQNPVGISTPWRECAQLINDISVRVSAPQRKTLSKGFVLGSGCMPNPTSEPRPVSPNTSSQWGQSMLRFDKPLMLPRMGTIEWGLSAFTGVNDSNGQGLGNLSAFATMVYQETQGLWPGSTRAFYTQLSNLSPAQQQQLITETEERWPYLLDGYAGLESTKTLPGISTNWWPPTSHFNGKLFNQQESTRSGTTMLTDMRCHINQLIYDTILKIGWSDNGHGATPMPLSTRIGTRVRTTNGGSGDWWWRPGAPLALVFDTITPAVVYALPEPIELEPGDTLAVDLSVPPARTGDDQTLAPTEYQIGISFNGFAAIEG